MRTFLFIASIILFSIALPLASRAQAPASNPNLDEQVKSFLEQNRYGWRDMNVSAADGQILYDLIVSHNYTRVLEIGTSTGHSGTWIAWALSKTGGRLVTIDIDEGRHNEAVAHFKEAGLSQFVDARLGDAHEIVPALEGPFDFVFSDADKEWYLNYFTAAYPKLVVGGCFVAHNVADQSRTPGIGEFLTYIRSVPNLDTHIERGGGAGMSISYKKSEQ